MVAAQPGRAAGAEATGGSVAYPRGVEVVVDAGKGGGAGTGAGVVLAERGRLGIS